MAQFHSRLNINLCSARGFSIVTNTGYSDTG